MVEAPKKPLTISIVKIFTMEKTLEQPTEVIYTIRDNVDLEDKDKEIVEMHEELKMAHLVIAQIQHDNRG